MRARGTIARHAHLRSPSIARKAVIVLAAGIVAVLVSTIVVVTFATYDLTSEFAGQAVALEDEVVEPPTISAYEGAFDVLIVGTDECEEELKAAMGDRCSGPDANGQLNDVNMLVHVADNPRRVTVISFPL